MSRPVSEAPGWVASLAALAASLFLASMGLAFLAMGECLTRDGSAAMHACDAGKKFSFWAYAFTVASLLLAAMFLRRKWGAGALIAMLFVPFAALQAVLMVEQLIF